mmetsp:Transcript_14848/g.52073  ORF Transcript_14848/g.52073 Transcript_14848/m.52073 type:complete len:223 (-) Transcript_14848:1621-2289(-)
MRAATSISFGILPISQACTALLMCLSAVSRSPSVHAAAASLMSKRPTATCAVAHSRSSSPSSWRKSSASTSPEVGGLTGCSNFSAVPAVAPAPSFLTPPSSASSASHSRSYMLPATAPATPPPPEAGWPPESSCTRQRRPSKRWSNQMRTRRHRLKALCRCRPSSTSSSCSARRRSACRLAAPFQAGDWGPDTAGTTFSTSTLITTGPVVSGMASALIMPFA